MQPDPQSPPGPPLDFEATYHRWFDYVWRTLRRLGVREAELEDAAQEVFVVVHRRLPEFDTSRPVKPWLAGIAWRVAARERRRPRHHRETMTESVRLEQHAGGGASPEAMVVLQQRRARVLAALDTLDQPRRVIFVMHELDDIACPDIAEALEVPLNTVYSRLRVARQRFRAALDRLRLREGEA